MVYKLIHSDFRSGVFRMSGGSFVENVVPQSHRGFWKKADLSWNFLGKNGFRMETCLWKDSSLIKKPFFFKTFQLFIVQGARICLQNLQPSSRSWGQPWLLRFEFLNSNFSIGFVVVGYSIFFNCFETKVFKVSCFRRLWATEEAFATAPTWLNVFRAIFSLVF